MNIVATNDSGAVQSVKDLRLCCLKRFKARVSRD